MDNIFCCRHNQRQRHRQWQQSPHPIILLLLLSLCFVSGILAQQQQAGIWLTDPPARVLESKAGVAGQRLPERTCPTLGTAQDVLATVPAGVPFRVQWHDITQQPVKLAKLELFSGDNGHLLARLETEGGGPDGNATVSTQAQLPAGLRCAHCLLRLSVELDERIQLLSCAQVRVQPVQLDGTEPVECIQHGDCGGNGEEAGGECVNGQCFCRGNTFLGGAMPPNKCANNGQSAINNSNNNSTFLPTHFSAHYSVRFPASSSHFRWLPNPEQNSIQLGLSFPTPANGQNAWFILGLQSTEGADPKCQLAMAQWKQRFDQPITSLPGNVDKEVGAHAGAAVIIRVEQAEGENSLMATKAGSKGNEGEEPSRELPPNRSVLNIKKIDNATTATTAKTKQQEECMANQRWEQCPEASRQCEPSCDWTAFPESIPSCPARSSAQQCVGPPRCVCVEGFVRLGNELDECKPFSFCQAAEVTVSFESTTSPPASSEPPAQEPKEKEQQKQPPQQQCPQNETWEKCGSACEPSCRSMYSEEPCGASCEAPGCTCADNFVRAESGKCIPWNECPNLREQMGNSTNGNGIIDDGEGVDITGTHIMMASSIAGAPVCAENETLNECGRVCEAVCESLFDRPECQQCGQPACACRQGYARLGRGKCIYWGDCPVLSAPLSTGETTTGGRSMANGGSSVKKSKQHSGQVTTTTAKTAPSSNSSNKSALPTTENSTTTTVVTAATEEPPMDLCTGKWGWPVGCSGQKCLYTLEWNYEEQTDSVQFSLDTRPAVARKMPRGSPIWSGVGFSPSGTLLDADMIVIEADQGELNGGKVRGVDMHVDEELEQLRPDRQQDVVAVGQFVDGQLKAKFSRKRRTGDAQGEDLEFGDDGGNCFRFLFPVSGGRFEKSGNQSVPVADSLYASDAEICMKTCGTGKGEGNGNNGSKVEKEAGGKKQKPKGDELTTTTTKKEKTRNSCEREFRWPDGCKEEQCEYLARWEWKALDDSVQFNISSRGIGRWTGIGFSRNGRMPGSDIVTGWVYAQKPYITDRFAFAQQLPAIDPADRQDLFDIGGKMEDDVQTISFRRKVLSADHSTDLDMAECLHFLFPVQGGRVLARSSRDFQQARTPIGFHDQQQPIASAKKICLCDRPADFKPAGEQQKFGRARLRRAATIGGAKEQKRENTQRNNGNQEEGGDSAGPYQCADIALIQVLDGGRAVRVVDAFGLSNDSVRPDELWGGRQSILGVEVQRAAADQGTDQMMTVWVRKTLKDPSNQNADLAIQRDQIPVFLASGQGTVPMMSQAQRLEFAMVDLMAGVGGAVGTVPSIPTTTTTALFSTVGPTTKIAADIDNVDYDVPTSTFGAEDTTTTEPVTIKPIGTRTTTEMPETTDIGNSSTSSSQPAASVLPSIAPTFQPDEHEPQQPSDVENVPTTDVQMDENCFGGYAHPEGCMQPGTEQQCQYTLEWMVDAVAGQVQFQLNAQMPTDSWTGVGFSQSGRMANADALIVLLLPDGQVSVQDQYSAGYTRPSIDLHQNTLSVSSSSAVDGHWAVNFSRALFTGDREQDADLRQCQHFLFFPGVNALLAGSLELDQHASTPIISEEMICLGKCRRPAGPEDISTFNVVNNDGEGQQSTIAEEQTTTIGEVEWTTAEGVEASETTTATTGATRRKTSTAEMPTTTAATKRISSSSKATTKTTMESKKPENVADGPVRIAGTGTGISDGNGKEEEEEEKEGRQERTFNVAIRLPNERWTERLEDPDSVEFGRLAKKLTDSLGALIAARWPTLASLRVQKFAEGSVLSLLQVQFNGTAAANGEVPSGKQLKEFLQDSAARGMAAELILDKEMLEVQEERSSGDGGEEEEDKWGPLREMQAWVLVALGLLLLLCIVGALLFCAFRSRRHRRQRMTYPCKQPMMQTMMTGTGCSGMFSGGGGTGAGTYQQSQYATFPCEKDRESDTTTAKTSTTNGVNGGGGKGMGKRAETPRGIGEATYREWFTKVASKDVPSHYQENWQMPPPPTPLPRGAVSGQQPPPPTMMMGHQQQQPLQQQQGPASPYLSYPNDPAFYTLNGEHRILPPPPAYYRPF